MTSSEKFADHSKYGFRSYFNKRISRTPGARFGSAFRSRIRMTNFMQIYADPDPQHRRQKYTKRVTLDAGWTCTMNTGIVNCSPEKIGQ
jgi:hypothetical protein